MRLKIEASNLGEFRFEVNNSLRKETVKGRSRSEIERGEVKKTQAKISSRTQFVKTKQQVQGNTSGVIMH